MYYKNQTSTVHPILFGVPQGSVLGPILFCVYIKALQPSDTSIPCIKYADDTTFIISADSYANISEIAVREINHVDTWCKNYNMQLNKNKTRILFFCNNTLPQITNSNIISQYLTKEVNFLGFTLSHNLKWTSHIDRIISKLSSRLHILRILKNSLTKKDIIIAYCAYFQSILDYNFPLSDSFTSKDKSRIQCVINRAHRIICDPIC